MLPILIAPSLLAADFAQFGHEALRIERAGADWLHLDIMDGNFVDNISFGPAVVSAMAGATELPLDVHLMIARPDHYFSRFLPAASGITVHVEKEAAHDVAATLRAIRAHGCKAGLALNPPTHFSAVEPYLADIDLLLVMTVNPGFGGQPFLPETLAKVERAARIRNDRGLSYRIEVDGGITRDTAILARNSGADVLVAGTSVYHAPDAAEAIRNLRGGSN